MYELSRVRLHSVGPKAARYQDITLDLRGVGAPLVKAVQDGLFDPPADVGDRTPRRPSPATVLFLRNGDGKSVLIKLIFSVMLPGRRQSVGTRNPRILENFVLGGDVAHVALEWQHTRTGQLVVTGKASEWRGHVVSSDPERLAQAWYSFRPTAGFTLDALPFTEGGRLVSLGGFRDRFNEAIKTQPASQGVWLPNQPTAWTEHLHQIGLDPQLFDYQRKMNAGEGEAAEAFSFRSDEQFIDWLLGAVTNADDVRGLGDLVDGYASKLAERESLMSERDFVAGALERMTPLAAAAGAQTAAIALQRAARVAAEGFAAALTARHLADTSRLAELAQQATQLESDDRVADNERKRLNSVAVETRRQLARLRLEAGERELQAAARRRDDARATERAWRETAILLTHSEAHAEAAQVREAMRAREGKAAPVLAQRDAAAARLARGLLAVAAEADENAAVLEMSAVELDADVEKVAGKQDEATRAAERARSDAANAERSMAAIQQALSHAHDTGLIERGADIGSVSSRATAEATAAFDAVNDAHEQQRTLADDRRATNAELRSAEKARVSADRAAINAVRDREEATAVATALRAESRLRDLAGPDGIDLDSDTPTLLDTLAQAISDADGERTRLRIDDEADRHTLDVLGRGGLLPPPADVTDALRLLEVNGITAWSGWQYVAQLPAERREATLQAAPHLVDGVLLNEPAAAPRAQAMLGAARLLPRSIVPVSTTASMAAAELPPSGLAFVVPPNPAMYDEDKAEEERQALAAAQVLRQMRLAELDAVIASDAELSRRLDEFRRNYPPGRLDDLDSAVASSVGLLSEVEAEVDGLSNLLASIESDEREIADALPGLRAAAEAAADRSRVLQQLAKDVAGLPDLRDVARSAKDAAAAHDDASDQHARVAKRLRGEAGEARRASDERRRTARICRGELRGVPGGGPDMSQPVPDETLESLRATFQAAVHAYARVEVGADLSAELAGVEDAEARALAAVEALAPAVRARAQHLLRTPEGADAASRAAAADRVARAVAALEQEHTEQAGRVGELRSVYRSMTQQEVTVLVPDDIDSAEAAAVAAEAEYVAVKNAYEQIHALKERVDSQVTELGTAVERLRSHLDTLGVSPMDHVSVTFAGTADEARTRVHELRDQMTAADAERSDTDRKVNAASDDLVTYSAAPRFDRVTVPVRRQIVGVSRGDLAGYAADWEKALRPRLRSLTDELDQIDRHRTSIVLRLHGLVVQALKTLRTAQRLSNLPDGLGEWSGQEFLRIRFPDPDPDKLDDRLGQVLDEASNAAAGRDSKGSGKRDGLSLLLRGVRAALQPKGATVDMLKPDAVLRTDRVRVADIGDIFSGGQLLTAAIILYCTMAALRANDRGIRRAHAGVLFLDNPIGRASAGYLLELQMAVAEALQVQLVYTTGLGDMNALSVFPLIMRLRNDADLRAGLKYLSVAEVVRNELPAAPPDGTGQLSASRFFVKQQTERAPMPA